MGDPRAVRMQRARERERERVAVVAMVGGRRWWCRIGDGGTHTDWWRWRMDLRTVRKEGALAHRTNHAGITASRLDSTCRAAGNSMPKVMLIYRARNGRALHRASAYVSRVSRHRFSRPSLSLSLSTRIIYAKSIPHEFNRSPFFLRLFSFLFFSSPLHPHPTLSVRLQALRVQCDFNVISYLSRCLTISS